MHKMGITEDGGHLMLSLLAEAERQRRIKLNDEEIDEEANERFERQEWARRAIEAEQQRRILEYERNHRHDTRQTYRRSVAIQE